MALAIALAIASAAIEPTMLISLSTSPVVTAKIESPSPAVWAGQIVLENHHGPSWRPVAMGLERIALVATTPIVVLLVRPSLTGAKVPCFFFISS